MLHNTFIISSDFLLCNFCVVPRQQMEGEHTQKKTFSLIINQSIWVTCDKITRIIYLSTPSHLNQPSIIPTAFYFNSKIGEIKAHMCCLCPPVCKLELGNHAGGGHHYNTCLQWYHNTNPSCCCCIHVTRVTSDAPFTNQLSSHKLVKNSHITH